MYFLYEIMLDKFLHKLKLFSRRKRIRNPDGWNSGMAKDVALAYKTVPLLLIGVVLKISVNKDIWGLDNPLNQSWQSTKAIAWTHVSPIRFELDSNNLDSLWLALWSGIA
jgi:hypothetical protein